MLFLLLLTFAFNYTDIAINSAPIWLYSTKTVYFHTSPRIILEGNQRSPIYNINQLRSSDKEILYTISTRKECHNQVAEVVITYWRYHMNQNACLFNFGRHWHDWERIALLINNGTIDFVTFYQHYGSYSIPFQFVQKANNHPIVYVNAPAHGSYHIPYATSNRWTIKTRKLACTYFSGHYGKVWIPNTPLESPYRVIINSTILVDISNTTVQPQWYTNLIYKATTNNFTTGNAIWKRKDTCITSKCISSGCIASK